MSPGGRDVGSGLRLEPLQHQHIEQVRLLRNDDRVRGGFRFSGVIDPEQQEGWFARYVQADDDRMWVLVDGEGTVLGAAALYDMDDLEAEFGRLMVHPDLGRGRGLGLLLTRALLDEARDLGLSRVRLVVKADNLPARTVYERAGYVEADVAHEPDEIGMVVGLRGP